MKNSYHNLAEHTELSLYYIAGLLHCTLHATQAISSRDRMVCLHVGHIFTRAHRQYTTVIENTVKYYDVEICVVNINLV